MREATVVRLGKVLAVCDEVKEIESVSLKMGSFPQDLYTPDVNGFSQIIPFHTFQMPVPKLQSHFCVTMSHQLHRKTWTLWGRLGSIQKNMWLVPRVSIHILAENDLTTCTPHFSFYTVIMKDDYKSHPTLPSQPLFGRLWEETARCSVLLPLDMLVPGISTSKQRFPGAMIMRISQILFLL